MKAFWINMGSALVIVAASAYLLAVSSLKQDIYGSIAALLYATYLVAKSIKWYRQVRRAAPMQNDEMFIMTALHAMTYVAAADGPLTSGEIGAIDAALRRISLDGLPQYDFEQRLRSLGTTPPQARVGFRKDLSLLKAEEREQIFILAVLLARVSSPGRDKSRELRRLAKVAKGLRLRPERWQALIDEYGAVTA